MAAQSSPLGRDPVKIWRVHHFPIYKQSSTVYVHEFMMTDIDIAMSPDLGVIFAKCYTRDHVKKRYVELAKKVHPDKTNDPKASDAMANLQLMYESALDEIDAGAWHGAEKNTAIIKRRLDGSRGPEFSIITYLKKRAGDYGPEYVTDKNLVCVVLEDVAKAGKRIVEAIHLINSNVIKLNVEKYLPQKANIVTMNGGRAFISIARRPETAALEDVIEKFGPVDPKHVAWILSSLYDFCCFMQYQKLVHCALTPQNVFVDTKNHSIQVVGGWWFWKPRFEKLEVVPNWIKQNVAPRVFKEKIATPTLDLESVKALGRYCLKGNKDVPRALDIWLNTASGDDAVEEYKHWEDMRSKAFGIRKFVDFGNVASDAYKEKN